jgi:hypothetical protein
MEIRLRHANGADVGTVDVDDLPPDAALMVDGRLYVRNQRAENQWREMPVVTVKGKVEVAEHEKVPGNLPPVTMPTKADER